MKMKKALEAAALRQIKQRGKKKLQADKPCRKPVSRKLLSQLARRSQPGADVLAEHNDF